MAADLAMLCKSPVLDRKKKKKKKAVHAGNGRQDRQRKEWEDNTREWIGLEFAKSQRAVENRKKRRKLVVKSSVVPQRPSRSRDR